MSWTAAPQPARRPVARTTAAAAHATPGAVRLTRRGRVVVLLSLVGLLLAAFSLGRVGSQAAPRGAHASRPLAQTTVHPGETLWAVAKRVAPGQDPRNTILRLQEVNHLEGADVRAGQLLLLPR